MKWLQDNPVGMVLASIAGVFLVLALGMAIVWTLPVAVEIDEIETGEKDGVDTVVAAPRVSDMHELKVINEKPVFSESRLPVIAEVIDDEESEDMEDVSIAVKDAPDVKLTGIIITPDMKIVTLTPSQGGLESVMAYEGEPLIGEYVGWHVGQVNSRTVVLESTDGQQLELELQVHDTTIEEPPKPVMATAAAATATPAQAEAGQGAQVTGEDEQPLSRAEQIRQRIAERREELRLEQQQAAEEQKAVRAAGVSAYQAAIRGMTKNKPKDPSSDDKNDG